MARRYLRRLIRQPHGGVLPSLTNLPVEVLKWILYFVLCAGWELELAPELRGAISCALSSWDTSAALRFRDDKKANALMALTAPILRVSKLFRACGLSVTVGSYDYPPVWLRPSKPLLPRRYEVCGIPWWEDTPELFRRARNLSSVRHWRRMVLPVKIPWMGTKFEIERLRGLLEETRSLKSLFLRVELRQNRRRTGASPGYREPLTRASAWAGVLKHLEKMRLTEFQFFLDVHVACSDRTPPKFQRAIEYAENDAIGGRFQVEPQVFKDPADAIMDLRHNLYHIYMKCGKRTRKSLLPEQLNMNGVTS